MAYIEMTQRDYRKMMREYFSALAIMSVFAEQEENKEAMRMLAEDCDCFTDTYKETH